MRYIRKQNKRTKNRRRNEDDYQGYTNYPTFSLNLYNDDDGWAVRAEELWEELEETDVLTKYEAVKFALANEMEEMWEEVKSKEYDKTKCPNFIQDLANHSFSMINWSEIANAIMLNAGYNPSYIKP